MVFESMFFTATDIKHYAYCPSIIYIKYVLGIREKTTEYMEMGREIHDEKAITPIIAKYKPNKIIRNPYLKCKKYFLSGRPDYLFISKYKYGIVVDVKWAEPIKSRIIKRDHRLQIGAYALLVKCSLNIDVKIGVICYLKPQPKLFEINITDRLLKEVIKIIKKMREIVEKGYPVQPKISWKKCIGCNYRAYCPTPLNRPQHSPHSHNQDRHL